MAYKDTIKVGTIIEPAVNIRYVVGPGADNGPADVMLIQTLFHYVAYSGQYAARYLGLQLNELPAITGKCRYKTQQAILKFQMRNAKQLLNVDGRIHPASYGGRTITAGKDKRFMSITLLHFFATEVQVWHPEPTYIQGLIRLAPDLRSWLT